MANIKNTTPFKLRNGKLGETRVVTRNGKQYIRVAHNRMSKHSNTEYQFKNRAVFANCINLWKCMVNSTKPTYTEKRAGSNDYNRFMGLNLRQCQSFLTKEVLDSGGCVAHELVLSDGTLAPITLTPEGDEYRSNILVGELAITPTTARGEISKAIISNNVNYANGDTITLYLLSEYASDGSGQTVPYVRLDKVVLTLDLLATDGQWDSLFMTHPGESCLFFAKDTMGRCLVHSRQQGDTRLSSPATLSFGSRTDLYLDTLTEEAFRRSAESYGGLSE